MIILSWMYDIVNDLYKIFKISLESTLQKAKTQKRSSTITNILVAHNLAEYAVPSRHIS